MNEYSAWLRFVGSHVYHRTAPDYIRQGLSFCGVDLTRTGRELIDGDNSEPVNRRDRRCKVCLRKLAQANQVNS